MGFVPGKFFFNYCFLFVVCTSSCIFLVFFSLVFNFCTSLKMCSVIINMVFMHLYNNFFTFYSATTFMNFTIEVNSVNLKPFCL